MSTGSEMASPEPAEPRRADLPETAADDCSGCLCGSQPGPDSGAGRAAASVVACPNGPLLVRGDFEIVTPDGVPIPRDRETVALCRCGGSAIKPYCDGTHKLMKFDTARRRPVPPAVVERTGDAAS